MAALLTSATSARADDHGPGFEVGARPVWFATAGLTAGGTVGTGDRGVLIGGEASVVRMIERHFFGIYADGYYDFGADGTYVTIGPELGWIRRSKTTPLGF